MKKKKMLCCLFVTRAVSTHWRLLSFDTVKIAGQKQAVAVLSWATVMHWLLDQPSLQWDCGLMSPMRVWWVAECGIT